MGFPKPSVPSGAAGGSLAGTYPNPTLISPIPQAVSATGAFSTSADTSAFGRGGLGGAGVDVAIGGDAAQAYLIAQGTPADVGILIRSKGAGLTDIQDSATNSVVTVKGANLLGFFGKAPVARPAAPAQPAATGATNVTPFGYTTSAQADAIVTAVRALIAAFSNALGGNGLLS